VPRETPANEASEKAPRLTFVAHHVIQPMTRRP